MYVVARLEPDSNFRAGAGDLAQDRMLKSSEHPDSCRYSRILGVLKNTSLL